MKYLKKFGESTDYKSFIIGGSGTISKPNVSLLTDSNTVNYNPENPVPGNEILYKTRNGKAVSYVRESGFTDSDGAAATITSHTYTDGIGKIVFDRNIAVIPLNTFNKTSDDSGIIDKGMAEEDTLSTQGLSAADDNGWESITKIYIPSTIVTLPPDLYRYCEIDNIVIAQSVSNLDGWSNNLNPNDAKTISVEIGNTKFWSMTNCVVDAETGEIIVALNDAIIPNGVVTIPDNCFIGYKRDSIIIPDSVTTIGETAFMRSFTATGLTIGSGVTTIGSNAFRAIPYLQTINVYAVTPPSYASSDDGTPMFNESSKLKSIAVPKASITLYKAADGWKDYADKMTTL